MKMTSILATVVPLLLAAAPAWADGAPSNDCTGKQAGDSCYDFDWKVEGVCSVDEYGFLECMHLDAGTGGTGGAGFSGTSSSCSMRAARAKGGPEAAGLIALGALCAALQRRRRR
jgi:hypothetical protein